MKQTSLSPLRVRLLVFVAMVVVAVIAIYFIDRRAMTRMEQTQPKPDLSESSSEGPDRTAPILTPQPSPFALHDSGHTVRLER